MSESPSKLQERLLYLASPIGLLAVWEILLALGFGDRRFVPAPSDIAVRFWELTMSGELARHTAATLWRVFAGFVIGAVPAVAIGLLMAMFRPARIFFDPLIAALMPIPKVALMPLLLLAFGFGDASKIALVATAVFFPVIVNTYAGAANIDRIYWDVAKNFGASTYVMFSRVVFFGALPLIFAGLKTLAGRLHVCGHRGDRHFGADLRGCVPGNRAQGDPVERVVARMERSVIRGQTRRKDQTLNPGLRAARAALHPGYITPLSPAQSDANPCGHGLVARQRA